MEGYVTVSEAARASGLKEAYIRQLLHKRQLASIRIGHTRLIAVDASGKLVRLPKQVN